jgi:DEAD/DEAH box helicase
LKSGTAAHVQLVPLAGGLQIEKEVSAFSRSSRAVRTTIVVGGVNMGEQRADLRAGVEIVVATPGRFIDHLQQRNTSLGRISFIVLDEADRMLDMGFEPQISGERAAHHNWPVAIAADLWVDWFCASGGMVGACWTQDSPQFTCLHVALQRSCSH